MAPLVVGGLAGIALALLVWALGYLGSLPFGAAPGADPQQGSNLYLPLVAVWATAAAAALAGALLGRRTPLLAVVLALAAIIAGFAAPLLLAPAGDGALPMLLGVLAWLVPAAAIGLGLAAIGPLALRRGSR
jgi:hypothetical protein